MKEGFVSLISIFRYDMHYDFPKKNFNNLLYGYLNSLKHGAPKEISLAAQALALLALTIGYRDNASELLKDSSAPISRALTTDSEEAKAKVVLSYITFVGANDPEEIKRAMQIIWQFIHQKSGLAYHFSNLLEIEDRSVRMAASQALAVFKIDDLEDFSCDAIQTLKEKIID